MKNPPKGRISACGRLTSLWKQWKRISTVTREKILETIKEQPYLIGHWIGFEDLTTLHNEWIKSFLFAEKDQTLLAHRGSYKTPCLSIAIALLLAKEIKKKRLPCKLYSENMNKYIKIASYLKKEWGNIRFLDETDHEYIDEILDYSENAAHDDCPDSAASIIRALTTRVRLNHVEGGI